MDFILILSALLASANALPAIEKRYDAQGAPIKESVITLDNGHKYWWLCEISFCYPMFYEDEQR